MIGGNAAGRWRVAIIRLICNMSFSFPLESWWQKEIHIGQNPRHKSGYKYSDGLGSETELINFDTV